MWKYKYGRTGNDCWLEDEFIYDGTTLVHIQNHRGWFGVDEDMKTRYMSNDDDVVEYLESLTLSMDEVIEAFKER